MDWEKRIGEEFKGQPEAYSGFAFAQGALMISVFYVVLGKITLIQFITIIITVFFNTLIISPFLGATGFYFLAGLIAILFIRVFPQPLRITLSVLLMMGNDRISVAIHRLREEEIENEEGGGKW